MRILLHIDTAGETGMVCLSADGELLQIIKSENQKEHASFLHDAVHQLMLTTGSKMSELDAIVVTEGPGSYTGLRVGLSSAKGFCFALNIPLITLNALELLAHASIDHSIEEVIYWPMIDARREEVFTATYDKNLSNIESPAAMILTTEMLEMKTKNKQIIFSGSGAVKVSSYINTKKIIIKTSLKTEISHCILGFNKLEKKEFSDILYSEPLYIKEFYDSRR